MAALLPVTPEKGAEEVVEMEEPDLKRNDNGTTRAGNLHNEAISSYGH